MRGLEIALSRRGLTATAERLYGKQLDYLRGITDLEQRALEVPFAQDSNDPRQASTSPASEDITRYIQLAEAVGVGQHPAVALLVVQEAIEAERIDLLTQWQPLVNITNYELGNLMLQRGLNLRYDSDSQRAISWSDRAFTLFDNQSQAIEVLRSSNGFNNLIEPYLFAGEYQKAQQWLTRLNELHTSPEIWSYDADDLQVQQSRLTCLNP